MLMLQWYLWQAIFIITLLKSYKINTLVRPYQILLRNNVTQKRTLILFGNLKINLKILCGFLRGEAYKLKRRVKWKLNKVKPCFLFFFTYPQAIQVVDEFVSTSEQIWRNLALHNLLTNGSSAETKETNPSLKAKNDKA